MSVGLLILLLVLVAGAAAVTTLFASRAARRRRLRERFGSEYDHAVSQEGDEKAAQRRLSAVARRRQGLEIRPLPDAQRHRYVERWTTIRADFVEDPARATDQAEVLIAEVMEAIGYPPESFGSRAEMLAADDPEAVENYREANALRQRDSDGRTPDTEQLRTAMVRYRKLYDRLVHIAPGPTEESGWRGHHAKPVDAKPVDDEVPPEGSGESSESGSPEQHGSRRRSMVGWPRPRPRPTTTRSI